MSGFWRVDQIWLGDGDALVLEVPAEELHTDDTKHQNKE
jgi:hypothetical protein